MNLEEKIDLLEHQIHEMSQNIENYLEDIDELESKSETLADTVNMLSPLIMECHELKAQNRELTEILQAIRNDLAEHDYISTHTMRRLIEGVEQ